MQVNNNNFIGIVSRKKHNKMFLLHRLQNPANSDKILYILS